MGDNTLLGHDIDQISKELAGKIKKPKIYKEPKEPKDEPNIDVITSDDGSKVFSCKQCEYKTTKRGHMVRHTRTVHSKESKSKAFKCEECPFSSTKPERHAQHAARVHSKSAMNIASQSDESSNDTSYPK